MSFLTDIFEGNFSNAGHDLSEAPSSFVRDWSSEWPYLAAGGLAAGAIFAPELLPLAGDLAAGGGEAAATGLEAAAASGETAATGLDAASAAFGPFDPALFSANTAAAEILPTGADLAAGAGAGLDLAAGGGADLAAGAGGDLAAGAGTDLAAGADALPAVSPAGISAFTSDPAALDFAAAPDPFAAGSASADPFALSGENAISTGGMDAGPATLDTGASTGGGGLSSQLLQDTGSVSGTDAAVSQGAAAEAGAGAKSGSVLSDLFSGGFTAKDAALVGLAGAPLALTLMRGQPSLDTAGQQAQSNANTLAAYGQQQLQMAQSGQLNAGQMAYLQQMRQNLTNQYLQTMYNQGVQDPTKDTRWPAIQAQIDMQVNAQTATYLQQEVQNGLSALSGASGTLVNISQQQMASDQAFTNNLVNATSSAARILAGGSQTIQLKAA